MERLPSHEEAQRIASLASGKRRGVGWLPVAALSFDPVVNRELRDEWVKELVDRFNPDALGVLLVSVRANGTTVVIDGQHRTKAYLAMGWGDQQIECEVFDNLTVEEEAALFVLRNRRRNLSHMDTLLKLITAGDPEALAINGVVRECGLNIHKQAGEGHVTASLALQRIYRGDRLVGSKQNPKALGDTLGTVVAAWGRESSALNSFLIQGIGLLFLRENGRIDKVVLGSKLAQFPGGPLGVLGRARAAKDMHSKTMPHAVAGVIADLYNKGRRKGESVLQDWWGK